MATAQKISITVETTVNAPVEKVWKLWSSPEHIMKWCNASDDWHAPKAENDLRTGGKFLTRMEAKDGSFGFDFEGEYTTVEELKQISYVMADGREVTIIFTAKNNQTTVTETFDAETINPTDMQRTGWQAILNNFKKYAETSTGFEKLNFTISIDAGVEKVYKTMLEEKTYNEWAAIFNPTSHYKGSWEKDSKMLFIGTDDKGNTAGMVSRIKENIPNKFVSIEHYGFYNNGNEITDGPDVESWAGASENYTFNADKGKTTLSIDMDSNEEYKSYFSETWPKALNKLKEICEK